MKRRPGAVLVVCALTWSVGGAGTALAAAPPHTPAQIPAAPHARAQIPAAPHARAQIFATSNTAIITDPDDPRLRTRLVRFERQVRRIIRANGAGAGGSTLLDGVFWSSSLGQTTYERSREFDVSRVSTSGLHHIADLIRKRYQQESVLTFERLPRTAPRTDAVEIEVAGADVRRLHDALVADPVARDHLGGGSVTVNGRLILIAGLSDRDLARRLATGLGSGPLTEHYGDEEFVEAPAG
jgi:hypothetical protein